MQIGICEVHSQKCLRARVTSSRYRALQSTGQSAGFGVVGHNDQHPRPMLPTVIGWVNVSPFDETARNGYDFRQEQVLAENQAQF